jgi:ATP-dependent Clp protease ATP-binding subunit ClpC
MFETFTDRARRAVVLAQEEARLLKHNYIGTEHVLLGLIHDPDEVFAQVLASHGLDIAAIRSAVVDIVGEGTGSQTDHIPFTPRAKRVLELSLRESLQLGHNYIGSEHILLGLIREGEGVGAQVLTQHGVNLDELRVTVIREAGSSQEAGETISTYRWPEGVGRARGMCRHLPGKLSVEVHEISGGDPKSPVAVRLIICTACGTTVGGLPA